MLGEYQRLVLLEMYLNQGEEWDFTDPWFITSLGQTKQALIALWGFGWIKEKRRSVFMLTEAGIKEAEAWDKPWLRDILRARKEKTKK